MTETGEYIPRFERLRRDMATGLVEQAEVSPEWRPAFDQVARYKATDEAQVGYPFDLPVVAHLAGVSGLLDPGVTPASAGTPPSLMTLTVSCSSA